eukprot:snap_masked-scaffold_11-processed-gene-10.38-mRNA-1 protein AED:0.11 eAED:0.11 QI:113/1/1/1/1/1/4/69/740
MNSILFVSFTCLFSLSTCHFPNYLSGIIKPDSPFQSILDSNPQLENFQEVSVFYFEYTSHNTLSCTFIDSDGLRLTLDDFSLVTHNPAFENTYHKVTSHTVYSLVIQSFANQEATLTAIPVSEDSPHSFHLSHSSHLRSVEDSSFNGQHYVSYFPKENSLSTDRHLAADIDIFSRKNFTCGLIDLTKDHVRRRKLPADLFEDCYTQENQLRALEIGIVADYGYFLSYNSDVSVVQHSIEVILSLTNLIYFFQFNFILRLRNLIITTNQLPFDCNTVQFRTLLTQAPDMVECFSEMADHLRYFRSINANFRSNSFPSNVITIVENSNDVPSLASVPALGYWHLLTDSYPPVDCSSCEIGIAFFEDDGQRTGSICKNGGGLGSNVAVTTRTAQTWLTFAHEMGHGLGASHSFENGQGTTGGLMDYGDGKFKGQYQFNTLRKVQMCNNLEIVVQRNLCGDGVLDLFPVLDEDDCSALENNEDCALAVGEEGKCREGQCFPIQVLLQVTANQTAIEFLIEIAEFSPVSPADVPVFGDIVLASPADACEGIQNDVAGSIVLIERGGCRFTEKALAAGDANALGIIIYNDEDGPPAIVGGEVTEAVIPVISISRKDGRQIINFLTDGEVEAEIGPFAASLEDFEELQLTLWEEYFVFFQYFLGLGCGFSFIYSVVRYRDYLYTKVEDVYDEVVEVGYKVQGAVERGSVRLANMSMAFGGTRAGGGGGNIHLLRETSARRGTADLDY